MDRTGVPRVGSALASRALEVGDGLTVGTAIRVLREHSGLSARQLSVAAGLSPAYVNKVESGQIEPSLRSFAKIARQLGMTQREVFLLICKEADRW